MNIIKDPPNPGALLVSRKFASCDHANAVDVVRKSVMAFLPRDLACMVAEYAPCLAQYVHVNRMPQIKGAIERNRTNGPNWLTPTLLEYIGRYGYEAVARVLVQFQLFPVSFKMIFVSIAHFTCTKREKLSVTLWTFNEFGRLLGEKFIAEGESESERDDASIPSGLELVPNEPLKWLRNDLLLFGSPF